MTKESEEKNDKEIRKAISILHHMKKCKCNNCVENWIRAKEMLKIMDIL